MESLLFPSMSKWQRLSWKCSFFYICTTVRENICSLNDALKHLTRSCKSTDLLSNMNVCICRHFWLYCRVWFSLVSTFCCGASLHSPHWAVPGKAPSTLEQFMKNCNPWEGLTLEKFREDSPVGGSPCWSRESRNSLPAHGEDHGEAVCSCSPWRSTMM